MKGSSFYGKTLKCHSDSPLKQGDLAVSRAGAIEKADTTAYKSALDAEQKAAAESEEAVQKSQEETAKAASEALSGLDAKLKEKKG